MILDHLGKLSDDQGISHTGNGSAIVFSDSWMDLGEFTDAAGVTSHRDIGPGTPLYVHFRVTSAFANLTNDTAVFRAVLFIDNNDPPNSASGSAIFIPASHEVLNIFTLGFASSLAAGNTFILPVASPSGVALDPDALALSRSIGRRYLRVAYQISHPATGGGTTQGRIEAIVTTQSSTQGLPQKLSGHVGGIYPATHIVR